MMAAPAHYLADEAKREAKAELRAELVRALRDVGASCSDSTSLGDAFGRVADKLEGKR